jgi:endonuclease-3
MKDWSAAFQPLIKKYKGQLHPLTYKNLYQLLVMVVLSAQDSDKNINNRAPELFASFPNMEALANANEDTLAPFLKSIRNGRNKAKWLMGIAQKIKADKNIPLTMEGLTALSGIGRKSANVIMREMKAPAEGVIVDLHVVRVAPRIGITKNSDPKKIEEDIMNAVPKKDWGEIGMAISFLGRETCRPTNPLHSECVMNPVCEYFASLKKSGKAAVASKKEVATPKAAVKKSAPVKKAKAPAKKIIAAKAAVTRSAGVKKQVAKKAVAPKAAAKKKK